MKSTLIPGPACGPTARPRLALAVVVAVVASGLCAEHLRGQQLYRSNQSQSPANPDSEGEDSRRQDSQAAASVNRSLAADLRASRHLPASYLEPIVASVRIRSHQFSDLAMAFYQPGLEAPSTGQNDTQAAGAVVSATDAGSEQRTWRPGTLFLRQDVYFEEERAGTGAPKQSLRPIVTLPLDAVEYLLHALTLAYFERALSLDVASTEAEAGSELVRWLEVSSSEFLPDVPDKTSVDHYISAIASFASHQLALRNEIERTYRRRATPEARQRFCRAIEGSLAVFSTWKKSFNEMSFTGYTDLPEGRRPPQLRPEDKRATLDLLLEIDWTGDPRTDLEPSFCGDTG